MFLNFSPTLILSISQKVFVIFDTRSLLLENVRVTRERYTVFDRILERRCTQIRSVVDYFFQNKDGNMSPLLASKYTSLPGTGTVILPSRLTFRLPSRQTRAPCLPCCVLFLVPTVSCPSFGTLGTGLRTLVKTSIPFQ